jgi:hypothetical protein
MVMGAISWTWADLSDDQMKLVAEAEGSLGADYLLAYRPWDGEMPRSIRFALLELQPAGLDESQLDCLIGLESQVDAVIVAYRRGAPLEY